MHKLQTTYYCYSNLVHYTNYCCCLSFYYLFLSNYNNLYITIFSITTPHPRRMSLSTVLLFYANSESITRTQQNFFWHFNVLPCGRIPDRNTILRWMRNENKLLKKKPSEEKSKSFHQKPNKIQFITSGNIRKKCIQLEGQHLPNVAFLYKYL